MGNAQSNPNRDIPPGKTPSPPKTPDISPSVEDLYKEARQEKPDAIDKYMLNKRKNTKGKVTVKTLAKKVGKGVGRKKKQNEKKKQKEKRKAN